MKSVVFTCMFFSFFSFSQESKMNFYLGLETGFNNQFKLNEVLKQNQLSEVHQNVIGLNIGYAFCPKSIGYYSDINYIRTVQGSIYHSFGFLAGPIFKLRLIRSSSISFIPFLKLRSHNVNVVNSQGTIVNPNQLATVSGGDLFFYDNTFGFGGKVIVNFNQFWSFGFSFDAAGSKINWQMKNQHITDIPNDDFSNFSLIIGYKLNRK